MMLRRVLYLSHPEVKIDPEVIVTEWDISDIGRQRVQAALQSGWPGPGWTVISSPENKARQTADMLASTFGLEVMLHPDTGEVDRSSTGYVPHDRHEMLANLLFAFPDEGPSGWESAHAATARMIKAYQDVVSKTSGDILFVGHGAVGSFLWCALTHTAISRAQDQPRGGCFWSGQIGSDGFRPLHSWQVLSG